MLKRCYRVQESLVRYWSQQAVELCNDIDDESLAEVVVPLEEALSSMAADRRIVVLGGRKSGKSQLLAGIAGCPVMAKTAPAGAALRWRFCSDVPPKEETRFLPEASLEGLELVDTRGCEDAAVAAAVAQLLPDADVVIAVVDSRNPALSPVWPLLAALPAEKKESCIVALTYADALSAELVRTLSDSVREICREKVGAPLAVYQVNPTIELVMAAFTDRVQEALETSPTGLRAAVREVGKRASDLLYKQGSVLKARDAVARTDSGFLAGIEQEIDNFLERQMQGVTNCVLSYSEGARRVVPALLRRVRRSFGWVLSPVTLLRLECYGSGVENLYFRLLRDDVMHHQAESDQQFALSCAGHWRSVRPRMKKTLECEIGDFPADALMEELVQLRQRLQTDLYEPFRRLKLRTQMAAPFKKQVEWMRAFVVLICICLFVAGLLGLLGQDVLAVGCVASTVVVWLLGSLVHILVGNRVTRSMREHADPLYEALFVQLVPVVQAHVVSRVTAYRRLYTAPRQRVANYETTLAPLQKRQSEIFRELRSVAPRL